MVRLGKKSSLCAAESDLVYIPNWQSAARGSSVFSVSDASGCPIGTALSHGGEIIILLFTKRKELKKKNLLIHTLLDIYKTIYAFSSENLCSVNILNVLLLLKYHTCTDKSLYTVALLCTWVFFILC